MSLEQMDEMLLRVRRMSDSKNGVLHGYMPSGGLLMIAATSL